MQRPFHLWVIVSIEDRDRAFESFMICILELFYFIIIFLYSIQVGKHIHDEYSSIHKEKYIILKLIAIAVIIK